MLFAMRKKIELPEVEPVKLEAFHGIRPGYIILSILVIAILLFFFLLFMLPGIVNGGKHVSFTSNITNVGVYMDGKYLGSTTGSRYFISSGNHSFRYVKDGVTLYDEDIEISHPVFFTLFFHRSEEISITASNSDELENAINAEFMKNVSAWSKVTSFNDVTSLPPLFKGYAEDISALGIPLDRDIWKRAIAHISSAEMYSDYEEACSILGIEKEIDASVFSEDGNEERNYVHSSIMPVKNGDFYSYGETSVEIGSYLGESYPLINEKRISVSVPAFSISSRPVSEYEYALFVSENPKWALSNKDNLIKEGLTDEYYLNGISLSTGYESIRPIRNISYYAAQAYVEWLSEKDGVSYSLPSEAEWSVAAYSAGNKKYASSLNWMDLDESAPMMMLGGVWEFTLTDYVPLMRIMGYDDLSLDGDDVIVKGGSYINDPSSVSADSVGMINKAASSDYVGFRIVKHE